MDLLDSILGTMDKPPAVDEKQKVLIKKQKEHVEKMKMREHEELNKFRKYTEERVDRFIKTESRRSLQFQPLNKIFRTVVHDVVEVAGLVAMSFGEEDVDRYIVVYKKDLPPSEDEILARRNGEVWNEEKAKEYAQMRIDQRCIEADKNKKSETVVPNSNYKDKYVHLIGQDAALKAAKKTESNKSYGFVPSENKKDQRSIEQTMADIQARKRQKLSHDAEKTEDGDANHA